MMHGYGIFRSASGLVYYGEWKEGHHDGQGYKRWPDGDEYWGEFKNDMKWGEGVKQVDGVFYKDRYEEDKRINRSHLEKVADIK